MHSNPNKPEKPMKARINPKTCSAVILSLGLSLTAWSQTSIPIDNPSFESPVLDPGEFVSNLVEWTLVGNPSAAGTVYPDASDYSGGAPDGNNIAYVTANADGDGIGQVLTDPSATLKPGTQYNLTVEVGNNGVFQFEGYRVQLLAGGVMLAEDDNTLNPANGTFATSTVTYNYDALEHEALLGEPLEIRLLSKALVGGETNFDNARLTVTFTETVASAGGPYLVLDSGALQLDGSGSVPADGETITAYDWDLSNNDNFDDASGATPASISFSDLLSEHGMELGENTVKLRITDSASNTATAEATVTLAEAEVTPGFDFHVNAGSADDTSEFWNDLVAGNPSGAGLRIDQSTESEVTRQVLPERTSELTHAFQFPGGEIDNVGGALLVNTNTTATRSFAASGWNTQPVSFEIWFKPDNLTPTPANGQILFEDGGGTGLGLFLSSNGLQARKAGGGGNVTYDLATDPDGLLSGPATGEFIQAVFTYNTADGVLQLFVNGTLVGSDTPGGGNWSGGDAAAFGTRGGNNTGGIGGGQSGTESFQGQIALIRVYSSQILTPGEVEMNYLFTSSPDVNPPVIAALDPANNSTGNYPATEQLVLTFDEGVELTNDGTITIKNLTASTEQVINLPNAAVTIDSMWDLTITLSSNLDFDTNYAVQISGNAVRDLSGNLFAGIDDDVTWTFTTAEENTNPPVITAKSPEDGAVGVSVGTSIVATFDQPLILGTGDIVIKDMEDGSTTQMISVSDDSQVSVTDNVLTINPASLLAAATDYAVLIPSTAVRNFSEVDFAGIANDTEWNFSTADLVSQLGILDLTANGGINPATGEPWKAADRYHLAYVTTAETTATSTDIADYNAFVQGDANSQNVTVNEGTINLGTVNWFALGSTSTVDAIDNAVITGSVWDIYNTLNEGATSGTDDGFLASGSADFWDLEFPGASGNSGNPLSRVEDGANRNIFTGTVAGGVAGGGTHPLGEGTASRRQWTGWRINWTGSNATESNTNPLAMAAISQTLFVIDLTDDVNPEFVSIADDVGGGPVGLDDEPVINYTVTFSEAMLPSTVTASDFGNAGSAGFTIDNIVQQENPAEFLVTVTPTSEGTLQLQINQSAVLTDLNGNPLDTSFALLDDTIIEVMAGTAIGYSVWAGGFPGLTDPDPTLDFDGGGLATGLEWVLGGDPTDPSDDAGLVPTIDATSDPDGKLLFTFRRNIDAHEDENTTIMVEYGNDLVGWTAAVHEGEGAEDITISVVPNGFGTGIDAVTVALPQALAADGKLFVRLNVEVESGTQE